MKDYNVYYADSTDGGKPLRDFVRKKLELSRRTATKLKNADAIKVNGVKKYMDFILTEGDKVEITLFDEESENIMPEPMDLDIPYEDEYLIIINKGAGIPVHPTRRHIMGTLANGLAYYWMDKGRNTKIRPVNRLDKDTSGLIVFAKNSHIQHLLSQSMGKPEFEKEYLAVVAGRIEGAGGTVDAPIVREAPKNIKRVVREDGDRAVTHYEVVERFADSTAVRLKLETGRTHQIRVHMAHIGHPLLGDEIYGGSLERIKRHALHADKMTVYHPINKQWLDFTAPLPKDMAELIEGLR